MSPRARGRRATVVVLSVVAWSIVVALPAVAAPGDLDPSFGEDGLVTHTTFFTQPGGNPIAIQPDGKIVVAGSVVNPDSSRERFAVARFDVDGSPDPTFGGDGVVTTVFRAGTRCYDSARSVLIQDDGGIVAVGRSSCTPVVPEAGLDTLFALVRYQEDGGRDPSFGDDGTVLTSFGDPVGCDAQATAAVFGPGGTIVAGGTTSCEADGLDARFALARYTASGVLDPSFDADGRTRTNFTTQYDTLTDLVVQPDGRVVAGGTAAVWIVEIPDALESRAALARYDLDGSLDGAFGGGDGKVTTSFHSRLCGGANESYGLALQPDGKIVEGGSAGCAATVGDVPHPRWALARFGPKGRLDPTFGDGGRVVTVFGVDDTSNWMSGGVALQANGRIVGAGSAGIATLRFMLARYRPDGRPDLSFGDDGTVRTTFGPEPRCRQGGWDGVAIQADGRIVVTGGGGCLRSFVMARFLPS